MRVLDSYSVLALPPYRAACMCAIDLIRALLVWADGKCPLHGHAPGADDWLWIGLHQQACELLYAFPVLPQSILYCSLLH